MKVLFVTLCCFELSYLIRAIWDLKSSPLQYSNFFLYCILWDVVAIIDGLSFFALLYFHYRNFKTHNLANNKDSDGVSLSEYNDFYDQISNQEVSVVIAGGLLESLIDMQGGS